ncbi:MAG TPA: hypothetical protein VGR22_09020 [Thermomicrobiales bacterium]|nr:hypothetical protein [Thermomicrobiales bacterium]
MRQALDEIGYQPVEVGGHEVLSIRGDFEQDLQAPTAYKFAGMNFGTTLDGGTLVFASATAPLAAVLDVVSGTAPSMLDVADVSMLLQQAPDNLASALLVQGVTLSGGEPAALLDIGSGGTPDVGTIATEMAVRSEMPPVAMALLGATVGGPAGRAEGVSPDTPEARAIAVLLMLSPEAAETTAGIVEERLATGVSATTEEPYETMFPERAVQMVPGAPVVRWNSRSVREFHQISS